MAGIDTIITGLNSANQWLDVISNNLANLNTTGYKAQTMSFEDLLSETVQGASAPSAAAGGRAPVQVGLGVEPGAILPNETQGSIQQTGVSTDVAIQGSGFLVLEQGTGRVFSRDGQLSVDAAGNLEQASTGALVLGWSGANGTVTPQGQVSPISLAGALAIPPKATTKASLTGNVEAGASTAQPLLVTVYDSLGNPLTVSFAFTPVASGLWTWSASLSSGGTIPGATGTFGGAATPFTGSPTISSGSVLGGGMTYTVQEDASGNLQILDGTTVVAEAAGAGGAAAGSNVTFYNVVNGAVTTNTAMVATVGATPVPSPTGGTQALGTVAITSGGTGTLTFNAQGTLAAETGGPITVTPSDGAVALSITPDMSTVTQYASSSTIALRTQDGLAPGTLESYSIGTDGTITGSYSNGTQQAIAQIALATFANPQGLTMTGQNQWVESPDSGMPTITAPGTGNAGTLSGGALEQSNVDMSTELTNVIGAQSSFQADARVITAITAMDQAAIQMVT